MTIDLDPHKIDIGDTDYPAEYNAALGKIQGLMNQMLAAYTSGFTARGEHDASTAAYPTSPSTGDSWLISVAGTISGTPYSINDVIVYGGTSWFTHTASDTNWTAPGTIGSATPNTGAFTTLTVDNITINAAEISSDTGALSFANENLTTTGNFTAANIITAGNVDGRNVSTDGTKLDAIEASADVTDATNVTAAGALMDSELAGIAAVKATTGTFLTADQTKLDAIEASADVTDEANVTDALDGATLTAATVAVGDKVLIQDINDSNVLKTVTTQAIADLAAGGSGSSTLLSTTVISDDATVDLSSSIISSTYKLYVIDLINVIPATDAQKLYILTSNDGGSSFDTGSTDYRYQKNNSYTTTLVGSGWDDNKIEVTGNIENGTGGAGVNCRLYLPNPSDSALYSWIYGHAPFWYGGSADRPYNSSIIACRMAAEVCDGLRFYMHSGNIASGIIKVYGVT